MWPAVPPARSPRRPAPSRSLAPGGVIRGITWWAAPPAGAPTNGKMPSLRLTTVIEDDLRMPISEGKRLASPTQFERYRVADRRDMFRYQSVDPSSMNYQGQGGLAGKGAEPVVVRDDTKTATALANQLRSVHELPIIAGSITIPFITDYYLVGDRVDQVHGRGAACNRTPPPRPARVRPIRGSGGFAGVPDRSK